MDTITLQFSPEPRLARVLRAAVIWEGRAWGMSASQAGAFAREVVVRFREIVGGAPADGDAAIVVSIEPGGEELVTRLGSGRGGRRVVRGTRRGKRSS